MNNNLQEQINSLISVTGWKLVGYLEDITEDTKCIEFWIPWEECGV